VPADAPKLLDDGNPDNNLDEGQNVLDSLKNTGATILEKSGEALDKAADFTEGVGKKVMEKGSEWADKFGEKAEDVGEAIFEKGGEALGRAKDLAAGLGSKILQAKDDLFAKAQAEAEKSGETTGSLIDKAKELNQKLEDKITGNNAKFADKPLDTGGSEFAKHDSFWEKADRFSKGDYQMKGEPPLKPGEVKIKPGDAKLPEKRRDDDHDDLIDDAIVEK
jgi:gas vesicle protein